MLNYKIKSSFYSDQNEIVSFDFKFWENRGNNWKIKSWLHKYNLKIIIIYIGINF